MITINHTQPAVDAFYKAISAIESFTIKIDKSKETDTGLFIEDLTATNKKHGIIVHLSTYTFNETIIIISVKVKTKGRGYRLIHRINTNINNVTEVLSLIPKINAVLSNDDAGLPTPRHFSPFKYEIIHWPNKIIVRSEIQQIKLMNVVTINNDGSVSYDINKPGANCWYLFDCLGYRGTAFNIISDGIVYYMTNRIANDNTEIVISNKSRRKSVEFDLISLLDQELINTTIKLWIDSLSIK